MFKYINFVVMIITSTLVMLALMYLNTYDNDRVYFSETQLYMALYMGATMAVIMLRYYRRRRVGECNDTSPLHRDSNQQEGKHRR